MAERTGKETDELPDGSFAFVEAGEKKDGKTTPLSKRHLPYKSADGKPDLPHVRDALARLDQCQCEGLTAEKKSEIRSHLEGILKSQGSAQARNALYEPHQANFQSVRLGLYRKDALTAGTWHTKDGQKLEATPERMDRWIRTFHAMRNAGIQIDCPVDHSYDSKDNMGFVTDLSREGPTLYSVHDIPRADDQDRIGKTIREVSVSITPHFVDGRGKDWGEAIEHISPCTRPVVFGQQNFVPIAARIGERRGEARVFYCRKDTHSMDLKGEICTLLGCDATSSDEDVAQKVKGRLEQHSIQLRQAKAERDQAVTRISQIEGEVTQLRAGGAGKPKVEDTPEVIALRNDVERMIGEGAEAKVLQFKAEGRITPAMEPAVRALLMQRRTKVQLRLKDGETREADVASQVEQLISALPKHAALDLSERTKLKLRAVENPELETEKKPEELAAEGAKAAARVQGREK